MFQQLFLEVVDIIAPVKRVKDRNKPVQYMTNAWLHAKFIRDKCLKRTPYIQNDRGQKVRDKTSVMWANFKKWRNLANLERNRAMNGYFCTITENDTPSSF